VAGFPVTSARRNGTVCWHFMEGFDVEIPIALTLREQRALYFSKGLCKPLQGTPMYELLEDGKRQRRVNGGRADQLQHHRQKRLDIEPFAYLRDVQHLSTHPHS
jgi:hypothetical protein